MTLGRSIALGFILIATSIAWADAPIHNIADEPVPTRLDGTPRTLEEVKEAVVKGCQRKGWRPVLDGETQLIGKGRPVNRYR